MTSAVPAHRARRVGLTAFLAGSLIASGVVVVTTVAGPASAETTNPSLYRNVVTLQTSSIASKNVVTSYDTTGGTVEQKLSSKTNDCTISSSNQVISFSASKAAGLRSGSIGVVDNLTGTSCAQVNSPSETLVLTLPGKAANTAVLDIEVQKDAVVTATMTLGTGPEVVRTLRSGQAAVNVEGDYFACRPGLTSSAPNSGVSDNCRWFIDGVLFDKIELTAVQGQFSLEGGGDGPVPLNPQEPTAAKWPTTMTYFGIADGINFNSPVQLAGSGMVPTVTITRVTDLDGENCTTIPYNLSGGAGEFTFNKPVGAANAQFYIDVAWKALPGGEVKETDIDYLYGNDPVVLDWCPTVVFEAAGGPLTADQAASLPDQETSASSTAKEFACIISSASTPPSGGYITINQRIYLLGDPRMRG